MAERSYWQTQEGRIEQAIREGLREAGVKGPLAELVSPILRAVMREIDERRRYACGVDAEAEVTCDRCPDPDGCIDGSYVAPPRKDAG